VTVINNAHATEIVKGFDGSVKGLRYTTKDDNGQVQQHELEADAVVLATGGYAYDRSDTSLLRQYASGTFLAHAERCSWHALIAVRVYVKQLCYFKYVATSRL
jgi:aspartate oxidase